MVPGERVWYYFTVGGIGPILVANDQSETDDVGIGLNGKPHPNGSLVSANFKDYHYISEESFVDPGLKRKASLVGHHLGTGISMRILSKIMMKLDQSRERAKERKLLKAKSKRWSAKELGQETVHSDESGSSDDSSSSDSDTEGDKHVVTAAGININVSRGKQQSVGSSSSAALFSSRESSDEPSSASDKKDVKAIKVQVGNTSGTKHATPQRM